MMMKLLSLMVCIRTSGRDASARVCTHSEGRKAKCSIWKLCFALIMAMTSHLAFAACTFSPSTITYAASSGSLVVPSSLPDGSTIPITFSFTGGGPFHCNLTNGGLVVYNVLLETPLSKVPGFSDVWATGYPGIGVRFRLWDGSALSTNPSPIRSAVGGPGCTSCGPRFVAATALMGGVNNSIELIKTGPISTGAFERRQIAADIASYAMSWVPSITHFTSRTQMDTLWLGGFNIVAQNATCDLSVGDVNRDVQLDSFQLKDVPVANGKFGLKNFTITANCKDAKTASFTFSGAQSTVDDSLFASTGTAQGLGLHVGTPYGDVPANGTSAQRTFSVDASSGVAELPVEVGYSRSAAAVTTGTFLSRVTVTLGYN